MVKKLFKYEFIYYFRTLWYFLPVVPVFGIMVRIFRLFDPDSPFTELAVGGSGMLCYIGSMAVLITTGILGIIRFYTNMYSAEGYLSFTLPVTATQHILVKLVTLAVFEILALLSVLIGVCIAISGDLLLEILYGIGVIGGIMSLIPTPHLVLYILEAILLTLIVAVSSPLLYYACISIGQTAKKNRILLAVIVYFVYYMITQVITTVVMLIVTVFGAFGIMEGVVIWVARHPFTFAHIVLILSALISAALGLVYFLVTKYMMTKKLNLE